MVSPQERTRGRVLEWRAGVAKSKDAEQEPPHRQGRKTYPNTEDRPVKQDVETTGRILRTIRCDDLDLESLAKIKDCEYVASYNWLDRETPTILVPGKLKYNLFHYFRLSSLT